MVSHRRVQSISTSSTGKPARGPSVSIIALKPFSIAGKNSLGTLPPTTDVVNVRSQYLAHLGLMRVVDLTELTRTTRLLLVRVAVFDRAE